MGWVAWGKEGRHDVLEFEKGAWPAVDEEEGDGVLGAYARFFVDEVDL